MNTNKPFNSSKAFDPKYPQMNLNQISSRSPFFKKNINMSSNGYNTNGPGSLSAVNCQAYNGLQKSANLTQGSSNGKDQFVQNVNDLIQKKRTSYNNGFSGRTPMGIAVNTLNNSQNMTNGQRLKYNNNMAPQTDFSFPK